MKVEDTHPVLLVDTFVGKLDREKLGLESVVLTKTGRPVYHPAVLLKFYTNSHLSPGQSCRHLERERQRIVDPGSAFSEWQGSVRVPLNREDIQRHRYQGVVAKNTH